MYSKSILVLLILLISISSQASHLVYTVGDEAYDVAGFDDESPFYLLDGKQSKMPSGGKYTLEGDRQDLIESAYLPEHFSIRRDSDTYENRHKEKSYYLRYSPDDTFKKALARSHESWKFSKSEDYVLLSGWVTESEIFIEPKVERKIGIPKERMGWASYLPIGENQIEGHPAMWLARKSDCSIIPTRKKKKGTENYLNWLVKTNQVSQIKELLTEKPKLLKYKKVKTNAMHLIALYRRNHLLDQYPALLKKKSSNDRSGFSSIQYAASNGNLDFLRGVDLNVNDLIVSKKVHQRLVLYSIEAGHDNVSTWLIDEHDQGNPKYEDMPLRMAILQRRVSVFKILLSLGSTFPEKYNIKSEKIVVDLGVEGQEELLEYILEKGASARSRFAATTLLDKSLESGNLRTVEIVLNKLEDLSFREESDGRTYLHAAAEYNNAQAIPLLIEKGLDIDAVSKVGKTPLYKAVENGSLESVLVLLDLGANPDIKPEYNVSPIWMATYLGEGEAINALISAGAKCALDPEFASEMVEHATMHDIPEIVSIALNECLSPDYTLYEEFSGIAVAHFYGSKKIIALLEKHGQAMDSDNALLITKENELDGPFQFSNRPEPEYSLDLQIEHGSFSVDVTALVNREGKLVFPKFDSALPANMLVATHKTLKDWQGEQPTINGKPTNAEVNFSLDFKSVLGEESLKSMGRLDKIPRPLYRPHPIFPYSQKDEDNGFAVIRFIVMDNGEVIGAYAASSSHPDFEAPAIEAVSNWKFRPGEIDGKAVNVRVSIRIRFEDKSSDPIESNPFFRNGADL